MRHGRLTHSRERIGVGIDTEGTSARGMEPFDDELTHALGDLEETARGCLLMRVVLDMPYRDISLALNIPEGTAASHVHRARAALRRALRPSQPGGVTP